MASSSPNPDITLAMEPSNDYGLFYLATGTSRSNSRECHETGNAWALYTS